MDSYLFDELFYYLNYMLIKLKKNLKKIIVQFTCFYTSYNVIRNYLKPIVNNWKNHNKSEKWKQKL